MLTQIRFARKYSGIRIIMLILAIGTITYISSCGDDNHIADYVLSGTVTDENSNPISGVTIKVEDKIDTADSAGKYQIPALTSGTHTIEVSKLGYRKFTATILIGNVDRIFDIVLTKNYSPVITSLLAERMGIDIGESVIVTVKAIDQDGDSLQYTWSATGGHFNTTQESTVIWTSPNVKGLYSVKVTVSDSYESVDKSIIIKVGLPIRLTTNPGWDMDPAWSPDGTEIAFSSGSHNPTDIWLMNADGTGKHQITKGDGISQSPAWSPNGMRIAFTWWEHADHVPSVIKIMDRNGGNIQTVTKFRGIGPAWSPDGSRIVFASDNDNPTKKFNIWVISVNDGTLVRLTRDANTNHVLPSWSPGAHILFTARSGGWGSQIYVMNNKGLNLVKLADGMTDFPTPKFLSKAQWTPDGRKIIFLTQDPDPQGGGALELWSMNIDGTDKKLLQEFHDLLNEEKLKFQGGGSISPDMTKIAFTAIKTDESGSYDIWVANLPNF